MARTSRYYIKGSSFQCGNVPLTQGHGMEALEWDLAWCLDCQAAHQIPNLPQKGQGLASYEVHEAFQW